MATVIDSLLIELGLDSSKFDKAQKKSVEELRKFDEANQKSQKNLQENAKKSAQGFEKARDALVSFGVAAFGAAGFVNFVNTMTAGNAALARNATLFNMSARELDAWGGVLKSVGGTADDFQASLQSLQSGVAGIKLGNAAMLTPLARLGALGAVDINKGTVDIYKLADALKAFRDVNGEQLTYTLAQQLGLNKNTFMVLEQGSETVRKLYGESYKLSGVNEKNTASAQRLQKSMGDLSNAFGGAKNSVMDGLYPTLSNLFSLTRFGIEAFSSFNDKTNHWASNLAVLTGAVLALNKAMKFLGVTATSGVWAAAGKLLGSLGMLLYSKDIGESEAELDKLRKENQAAYAVRSGSRNARNRNPGNLKYGDFAKAHGATGQDAGGFAIFPDMATGQQALDDLLVSQYYNKGQRSIASIIGGVNGQHAYSTTDQAAYINYLSKKLGINPNQELSLAQLHGMAGAIPQFEGMTGAKANAPMTAGTVNNNVQTSINTINVNTQATDANGVAKGINQAIQNNSLINAGVVGSR